MNNNLGDPSWRVSPAPVDAELLPIDTSEDWRARPENTAVLTAPDTTGPAGWRPDLTG